MSNILNLVIVLALIAVSIVVIYFFIVKSRGDNEPEDNTKVYNYMCKYSNNYFEGIEVGDRVIGEDRTCIYYIPTDSKILKKFSLSKRKDPRIQKVFIENDKLIDVPRNTLSGGRNLVYCLPNNPRNLTKSFRDNIFGRMISKLVTDLNSFKFELDVKEEALNRTKDLAMDNSLGILTVNKFKKLELIQDASLKVASTGKDKDDRFIPQGGK